jgi:hypothetical protein
MDVEIAEYALLKSTTIPASVKFMTVEFHFSSQVGKKENLSWVEEQFSDRWYMKRPANHTSTYPVLVKFMRKPSISASPNMYTEREQSRTQILALDSAR